MGDKPRNETKDEIVPYDLTLYLVCITWNDEIPCSFDHERCPRWRQRQHHSGFWTTHTPIFHPKNMDEKPNIFDVVISTHGR